MSLATVVHNPSHWRTLPSMGGRGAKVPALRRYRLRAALTQKELAERANVSASVVAKLEAASDEKHAELPTIRKLAAALGVSPSELMGE